jgi:hypothetical protein
MLTLRQEADRLISASSLCPIQPRVGQPEHLFVRHGLGIAPKPRERRPANRTRTRYIPPAIELKTRLAEFDERFAQLSIRMVAGSAQVYEKR